jgi:hypothetical protein
MSDQQPVHQDDERAPFRIDPEEARAFRQRCEEIVRDLPIPAPFDEHAFCDALGARRGRPIVLQAWPIQQAIPGDDVVSGFVVVERDRDLIFYERDTRRLHQQQIVAHEAAHLVLGHKGDSITLAELIAQLLRLAPDAGIRYVHRRAGARSREEFEAETLGRAILLHAYSTSARLVSHYPQMASYLEMIDELEGHHG